VNVAMAVAIDGGLITPTIIKAQELDLFSISRNWKELVDKAKAKKLTPAEYSSGDSTPLKC
jgi:pyruvate dehydrogenase E2 component (dihydrolipoamide acetyltransferase)